MIVLESSEELFRHETIVLVSENPRCFVVTMATSSSWRIPTTSLSTTEGSAANANATAASDTPAETPLFSSSFSSVRPEPVLVKLRFLVCKWRKRERETCPHRKSQQAHATGLPYPAARLHVPKRVFSRFSSGEYFFVTKPVLANCRFRSHRKMQENRNDDGVSHLRSSIPARCLRSPSA
jgi:hypothetical protein